MQASLEKLCQSCGMCCDGSLFTKVYFQKNGKDVLEHQPCPYWKSNCTIYNERPKNCRSFTCKVYRAVENQKLSTDEAQTTLEKVRELQAKCYDLVDDTKKKASIPKTLIDYSQEFEKLRSSGQNTAELQKYGAFMIAFFELKKYLKEHYLPEL